MPGRHRYRGPALVAAAAVLVAAGWLVFDRSPHHPGRAATHGANLTPAQMTTATRDQAATWVAQQVNPGVQVSCDPSMCSALKAHGVRDLLPLNPKADPAGSIVVATALVRSEFGDVASYAPGVIASFGTGSSRIDIRQASPGGPAAFEKALKTDQQQRKTVENTLANSLQIVASSQARKQLAGGQVDARLGTLIEGMATELPQPVHILSFGDLAPGATSGLPLRSAKLVGSLSTLRALRAFALAQKGNYCPYYTDLTKAGKQDVLLVEFAAPIPLELFSPPSP
jgi:hypothetical protein